MRDSVGKHSHRVTTRQDLSPRNLDHTRDAITAAKRMSEFDEEDPEVAAASAQGGYTRDDDDNNEGFVSLDAVKKHYRGDADDDEESDDGLDITEKLRKEMTCAVCLSLFRDPIALRCGHAYCRACAATLRLRSEPKRARCPACRAPLRKGEDEETPTSIPLRNACSCLLYTSPSPRD